MYLPNLATNPMWSHLPIYLQTFLLYGNFQIFFSLYCIVTVLLLLY